eukprot:17801-Heterococcus_DN1.PRE.4
MAYLQCLLRRHFITAKWHVTNNKWMLCTSLYSSAVVQHLIHCYWLRRVVAQALRALTAGNVRSQVKSDAASV